MSIRIPNVATEIHKDAGLGYRVLGEINSQLFLGFVAKPTSAGITFINPFWGTTRSNPSELLPIRQKDVSVTLSNEAASLGARANIEFNGLSPRIRISLLTPAPSLKQFGTTTIAFTGAWPLRGTYHLGDLPFQWSILRKQLEPFGDIVLRTTALRVLGVIIDDAVKSGVCRLEAAEMISLAYIKDALISDTCELLFDQVGTQSLTAKTNPLLPSDISNTYDTSQEGVFSRTVELSL
jgi:hypothetical protein